MKVIFLDIDGVLNSTEWFRKQHEAGNHGWPQPHLDPDAIAVLNGIIEKTGAYVVVSSTWRLGQLRTWLQDQLALKGFKGKVIGMTPSLNGKQRGDEIQDWLDMEALFPKKRLGPVESFVILDDDTDMGALYDRLVHIDYAEGLTEKYVPAILAKLEEPWPRSAAPVAA